MSSIKGFGLSAQRSQQDRRWTVTFRGRPVRNPLLRKIVLVIFMVVAPPLLLLTLFLCFFVALPLGILLDLPLKALGRRGCVITHPDGKMSITVDLSSFRRAEKTAALDDLAAVQFEPKIRTRPSGLADRKR